MKLTVDRAPQSLQVHVVKLLSTVERQEQQLPHTSSKLVDYIFFPSERSTLPIPTRYNSRVANTPSLLPPCSFLNFQSIHATVFSSSLVKARIPVIREGSSTGFLEASSS
ncbi:uncharacterized protein RAG0_06967 [Rhynchosporium agropyri]|uniref:Uncharacterized protein n=1 Tax=Rhynchosporium agropyri TaxID=914238 RepID=A0A1E1KJH2_9HELO|nr:uncharacterized protein RAG0_06967 [Rhynchosporium agropyri]